VRRGVGGVQNLKKEERDPPLPPTEKKKSEGADGLNREIARRGEGCGNGQRLGDKENVVTMK